jgi:hypothetical protein
MRKLQLLFLMLFSSSILFAQVRTISGTITESSGSPLPGVNVVVKGTATGTVTDVEGKYTLEIPETAQVLVFSSVGYVSEEMEIGNQSVINFSLVEDITALEEIVVVGYGTQKKENLTGSVEQVKGATIEKQTCFSGFTGSHGNSTRCYSCAKQRSAWAGCWHHTNQRIGVFG